MSDFDRFGFAEQSAIDPIQEREEAARIADSIATPIVAPIIAPAAPVSRQAPRAFGNLLAELASRKRTESLQGRADAGMITPDQLRLRTTDRYTPQGQLERMRREQGTMGVLMPLIALATLAKKGAGAQSLMPVAQYMDNQRQDMRALEVETRAEAEQTRRRGAYGKLGQQVMGPDFPEDLESDDVIKLILGAANAQSRQKAVVEPLSEEELGQAALYQIDDIKDPSLVRKTIAAIERTLATRIAKEPKVEKPDNWKEKMDYAASLRAKTAAEKGKKEVEAATNQLAPFMIAARETPALGMAAGTARRTWGNLKSLVGVDDPVTYTEAFADALATFFARKIGQERGVVTEFDAKRAKKFVPLVTDTPGQKGLKLKYLDFALRGDRPADELVAEFEALYRKTFGTAGGTAPGARGSTGGTLPAAAPEEPDEFDRIMQQYGD